MDTIMLLPTDPAAFAQVLFNTSDRYTCTKSSCLHSLCIPRILRTLKTTNKITVTVSLVGRTPLSVFPQETLCCPASKSNGAIILNSSNFIVSVASPLIKSFNYFR